MGLYSHFITCPEWDDINDPQCHFEEVAYFKGNWALHNWFVNKMPKDVSDNHYNLFITKPMLKDLLKDIKHLDWHQSIYPSKEHFMVDTQLQILKVYQKMLRYPYEPVYYHGLY